MSKYVTLKCRCGLPARIMFSTAYHRAMSPDELVGGFSRGVVQRDKADGADVTCYIECRHNRCCITAKTTHMDRPYRVGTPEHDVACEVARVHATYGWNHYMAYFIMHAELGPNNRSHLAIRECLQVLRTRYATSPAVLCEAYRTKIIPAI